MIGTNSWLSTEHGEPSTEHHPYPHFMADLSPCERMLRA